MTELLTRSNQRTSQDREATADRGAQAIGAYTQSGNRNPPPPSPRIEVEVNLMNDPVRKICEGDSGETVAM